MALRQIVSASIIANQYALKINIQSQNHYLSADLYKKWNSASISIKPFSIKPFRLILGRTTVYCNNSLSLLSYKLCILFGRDFHSFFLADLLQVLQNMAIVRNAIIRGWGVMGDVP